MNKFLTQRRRDAKDTQRKNKKILRILCVSASLRESLLIPYLAVFLTFPCITSTQNQIKKTGSIEGRVLISQSLQEDSEIASRSIIRQYSLESGRYAGNITDEPETFQSIVVYLKHLQAKSAPRVNTPPRYVIMDQKNERFVPHVLAVERGTEVRFLNSDSIYHNVFSLSAAKSFDLGRYPQGKYRSVLFDRAGIIKVYCDIHTHMNAYILVLDTPYFVLTDRDSRFRLTNIPAGEYELSAWYGRWQSKPLKIRIAPGEVKKIEVVFP